jgi:hypothetical protein
MDPEEMDIQQDDAEEQAQEAPEELADAVQDEGGEPPESDEAHPFDMFEPVGAEVVAALKDSKYQTLDALAKAKDRDLQKVKGIGVQDVKKIRALLVHLDALDAVQDEGGEPAESDEASDPRPAKPADGKLRATKYLALIWQENGKRAERNVSAGEVIDDLPKALKDEMIARGEASTAPPRKRVRQV